MFVCSYATSFFYSWTETSLDRKRFQIPRSLGVDYSAWRLKGKETALFMRYRKQEVMRFSNNPSKTALFPGDLLQNKAVSEPHLENRLIYRFSYLRNKRLSDVTSKPALSSGDKPYLIRRFRTTYRKPPYFR